MPEQTVKPLQATFDVDDYDAETIKGIGFEPGVAYQFTIEKKPQGKYMQYGAAKGGLFVLKKTCPEELVQAYKKHPDQFELFTAGVINDQPALVPGKDFEKFEPYLSMMVDFAWVHNTESGQKRLVFMSLNASAKESVNPSHPEWESRNVRLSRRLGYTPPEPKSKEKFTLNFLHPGVTISAEVLMVKQKNSDRVRAQLDESTIEIVGTDGAAEPQQKLAQDGIDPEIQVTVIELSEGCKSVPEVLKKVKKHLADTKTSSTELLGRYATAITQMKERGEIL